MQFHVIHHWEDDNQAIEDYFFYSKSTDIVSKRRKGYLAPIWLVGQNKIVYRKLK